jgi:ATP-binding cassette subfamily C protein EexD
MLANEKKTKKPLEESNNAFQNSQNFVNASLRNAEVITAMGMLGNIKTKWYDKYVEFLNLQSKASDEAGLWSNALKSIRITSQSLILGLGAYLAITGELTPGMMIAGSIIMGRAVAPLDLLTSTWRQFANARESYHRLEEILNVGEAKKDPIKLPTPIGRLSVEGVIVVPPGAKIPSLKSVNMDIQAGELVAVIGPSAAGKSTLARTMLGVWKPQIGKVRIDLAELDHWNKDELGQYLGYLPQDVELFEGTVADNIARFNEPDPQAVVQAAQIAGVHEMILRLPQGYDTDIGIGGATLSGGQRQRIGLARALYGMPKIVVLDEPNSNLDDVGEQALVNAILTLKKNGTTIVLITHRPSILSIVDKIALLVDGSLQMYGSRDEVLSALAKKNQSVDNKVQG